jgi:hypothetical protein
MNYNNILVRAYRRICVGQNAVRLVAAPRQLSTLRIAKYETCDHKQDDGTFASSIRLLCCAG